MLDFLSIILGRNIAAANSSASECDIKQMLRVSNAEDLENNSTYSDKIINISPNESMIVNKTNVFERCTIDGNGAQLQWTTDDFADGCWTFSDCRIENLRFFSDNPTCKKIWNLGCGGNTFINCEIILPEPCFIYGNSQANRVNTFINCNFVCTNAVGYTNHKDSSMILFEDGDMSNNLFLNCKFMDVNVGCGLFGANSEATSIKIISCECFMCERVFGGGDVRLHVNNFLGIGMENFYNKLTLEQQEFMREGYPITVLQCSKTIDPMGVLTQSGDKISYKPTGTTTGGVHDHTFDGFRLEHLKTWEMDIKLFNTFDINLYTSPIMEIGNAHYDWTCEAIHNGTKTIESGSSYGIPILGNYEMRTGICNITIGYLLRTKMLIKVEFLGEGRKGGETYSALNILCTACSTDMDMHPITSFIMRQFPNNYDVTIGSK